MHTIDKHQYSLQHKIVVWFLRIMLLLTATVIFGYVSKQLQNAKQTTVFEIQEITLMEDLPIPEDEPEPEPEPIIEETIEEVEIEPMEMEDSIADDTPATDDNLGLDSIGEAGLDSFGLRAKKGGRSLIQGSDNGVARRTFEYYASQLEKSISNILQQHDEIRLQNYIIDVAIWISTDGHVRRLKLDGSTGKTSLDKILQEVLSNSNIRFNPPPDGLRQPVRLKIRSSGIG